MFLNIRNTATLFLFVVSGFLKAQPYGNEWINLSQQYYKITVTQTGIYRVTHAELDAIGVPLASIDPRNIQVWRRGVEQAIYIHGEEDGTFDGTDYIEFYGKKNDGMYDSAYYSDPTQIVNPYYNLYTDSSGYFLTWGAAGKRFNKISVTSAAAVEDYHFDEQIVRFRNDYSRGFDVSGQPLEDTYDSWWDRGEGWMGSPVSWNPTSMTGGKFSAIPFTVTNLYTSGPLITAEARIAGRNSNTHVVNFNVGSGSVEVYPFNIFNVTDISTLTIDTVGFGVVSGTSCLLQIEVMSDGSNVDNVSPVFFRIKYPQTLDMSGGSSKYFILDSNATDISNLSIANPASNAKVLDISDENNIRTINATQAATLDFAIDGTAGNQKKLYIYDSTGVLTVAGLRGTNFQDDTASVYNYLIVTHDDLISSATDYKTYRESAAGGNYTVNLATVGRLYDQYYYGDVSPLAIRQFADFLLDYGDPRYLLLFGKAVTCDYNRNGYYRHDPNKASLQVKDLVPTLGVPGSDVIITSGLNGTGLENAIPTGRVPANDNDQGTAYLNKVIEHEAVPLDALWRKNLVHLSGGVAGEATAFLNNVNQYKAVAEDIYLGGKVTTFSKSTQSEIEFFNIAEQVNEGVQLVTFFGHSSSLISDIDIGFASLPFNNYNNKGKYPMLLINGCSYGNMYINLSVGEDWIRTADKGALHVLGHSDLGYATTLHGYTLEFYRTAFQDTNYFGLPVGDIIKETTNRFDDDASYIGFTELTQAQQFNLQGDPAVSLFGPQNPDLFIDDSRVSIQSLDGNPVTAISDSFNVQIVVDNFGMATNDSIRICIQRSYNNGQTIVDYGPQAFKPIYYTDTLNFVIASKDPATFGQNTFTISIDCPDSIPELNELNNTGIISYYMPLSGVNAIFPKEFSIIGSDTVDLIAQSTDLFVNPSTVYTFELDTNDGFQSPLYSTTDLTSGSLAVWDDVILPYNPDSIVYYWRVRYRDVAPGEDTIWSLSSFTYIPNQMGWSQGHFQQFRKDPVARVSKDFPTYTWVFDSVQSNVIANIVGNSLTFKHGTLAVNTQALVQRGGINGCAKDGMYLAALDQTTVLPYHPDGQDMGNCGLQPKITESFNGTGSGAVQTDMITYLSKIKQGDYVIFMSTGNAQFSVWSSALKDSIKNFGSDSIDYAVDGYPYFFIGQKGASSPVLEILGTSLTDSLHVDTNFFGKQVNGTITSTLIGPASSWGTYYHSWALNGLDQQAVNFYGVDLNENETLLTTFNGAGFDSLDLSAVADTFPYVKMIATIHDTVGQTAPQLKKWLVVYTGVPEGTINPQLAGSAQYTIPNSSEGDSLNLTFAFQNISNLDFGDTLMVTYTITNANTGTTSTITDTLDLLLANDTIFFSLNMVNTGFSGSNTLQVFVNPKILPEEYYSNNVLVMNFDVDEDDIHPVLDVVFDGEHILNGEIVSPSPMITITMHDDNDLLFKTDTVGIDVFLQRPCENPDPLYGCPIEKISMNDPDITWYPATSSSSFKVEYNPQNLTDGIYTLLVQVEDATGNRSGIEPYEIDFEVINKSSITNVLPYPNPFSTSTRFVFTLTGAEVPENMKIQIMTVTGRIVREITQDELGPLKIGNNITNYAWNGTDEFGDRLANGTYLYRVVVKDTDDNFEHRETKADAGFKRGFGKLVILR